MFEALNGYLSGVNNSKLVMAMLMLTLNIGSKYVDFGFSKAQEQLLRNSVTREFIIFAISFTATRDILISIIITSAFFIMSNILFHEESKHCIIPKRMKRINKKTNIAKMLADIAIQKGSTDNVTVIIVFF